MSTLTCGRCTRGRLGKSTFFEKLLLLSWIIQFEQRQSDETAAAAAVSLHDFLFFLSLLPGDCTSLKRRRIRRGDLRLLTRPTPTRTSVRCAAHCSAFIFFDERSFLNLWNVARYTLWCFHSSTACVLFVIAGNGKRNNKKKNRCINCCAYSVRAGRWRRGRSSSAAQEFTQRCSPRRVSAGAHLFIEPAPRPYFISTELYPITSIFFCEPIRWSDAVRQKSATIVSTKYVKQRGEENKTKKKKN